MGKALNIKDPATVELAAEVARRGNTTLTEAVNLALAARLEALDDVQTTKWAKWVAAMCANRLPEGFELVRDQPPIPEREAWE